MVGGGFLRIGDNGQAQHPHTLEDALWLALRQCATHSAGPLATVARLIDATHEGILDPAELAAAIRTRLDAADMPADRRRVAEAFLEALFDGTLAR
jgi:hypothetical protein